MIKNRVRNIISKAQTLGARLLLAVLVIVGLVPSTATTAFAQQPEGYWFEVRSIAGAELGITEPAGLSYSTGEDIFVVLESQPGSPASANLITFDSSGDVQAENVVAVSVVDPVNFAFYSPTSELFYLDGAQLVEVAVGAEGQAPLTSQRVSSSSVRVLDIKDPQGMTFDLQRNALYILDAEDASITRLAADTGNFFDSNSALRAERVDRISLASLSDIQLGGVAYNPSNDHLYVSSITEQKIYEVDETGEVLSYIDLSPLNLSDTQNMVFAPSGDSTDDPATMNLYLADGLGSSEPSAGRIIELSLTGPAPQALPTIGIFASQVHTIDAGAWSPSAPDTAGVDYHPGMGRLVVADSEVEEMTIYQGKNVYMSTPAGSLTATCDTTTFSEEPTGVGVNTDNGHIFFSDDSEKGIFEVNLGPDNTYCTADDIVTFISVLAYGSDDTEDVAYGVGKLFVADGLDNEIYVVDPGPNGLFDGVGDTMTHFDTAFTGLRDTEGVGYNPARGTLFMVSRQDPILVEMTTTGTLVNTFDISFLDAYSPSDAGAGPSSINPSMTNIFITDRGVDNGADPNENDGKIYEVTLGETGGNTAPTVSTPIADVNVLEDAVNTTINLWPSFADAESTDAQLTYSVTGNTNAALFTSTNITGNQNLVLDYAPNANGTANITVRAMDPGGLSVTDTFTVTITAVNDTPTNIALSASSVAENQPANTVVGALSSTDPDAGNTFTYSLVTDGTACPVAPDNASFNISGANLRTSASFDFETKNSYAICIRTTDQGSLAFTKPFTITVTDINENTNTAPTVSTPIADVSVFEDAANTTIDLWPSFADGQDADSALTYTVTGNTNAALFTSVSVTGNQNLVLDYAPNINGTSNITVRAADTGGLFVQDTFIVTVTAVNDAPSFTPGGNQTVLQGSGPQIVAGWATAINDGDPEVTQTLSFNVTNGNNALFSVQPAVNATNGNLTYTPAANAAGSTTVNATLTDNGGTANGGVNSFGPLQFTIIITGTEPQPPTDITLSNSSVDENKPAGTLVGAFSTTDDSAGPFTYSFCGGVDDGSFLISGVTLQTKVMFDYETKNSYSICVRSTDSGGLFFNKNFTITVNNVLGDTATFIDVPTSYWAWQQIEAIYAAGITGGCGPGPIYCPIAPVTRAQMAVFLLRGIHGGSYTPPPATGLVFSDVPTSYWAAAWIEQLAAEGITSGCAANLYCPEASVNRDQMAVFLLRAKHGSSYTPPAPSGLVFADVPLGYWAGAWIEQLAAEGVTGGCGTATYCPTALVTRDQMAVFLQRTFNLPLP